MTDEKIKEVIGLVEKAHQYNEKLYNLVGDLIPGRDAKEIRRQIFINNRLYEQTIALLEEPAEQSELNLDAIKLRILNEVEKICHRLEEADVEIKRLKKESRND